MFDHYTCACLRQKETTRGHSSKRTTTVPNYVFDTPKPGQNDDDNSTHTTEILACNNTKQNLKHTNLLCISPK